MVHATTVCKPEIIFGPFRFLFIFLMDTISVRLNLFNHVLALFCAKFTCDLAIRYPVFRWELCKDSV